MPSNIKVGDWVLRALVALVAFSGVLNIIYESLVTPHNSFSYVDTQGPFKVTYDHNNNKVIGNIPVDTVYPGDTLVLVTKICLVEHSNEDFFRTVVRISDDEIVSTAAKSLINNDEKENCQNIDSIVFIDNWRPGMYEIHRRIVLNDTILYKHTMLPAIRFDVVAHDNGSNIKTAR
jgi:hypothetical protein